MNTAPPSKSIIIEASAGSGKTYQLINRLVQLLLDGANPANIVAITFTRKAASEMQSRLQERLYTLAISDEDELTTSLESMGYTAIPRLKAKARGLYENVLFSPQTIRCTTFHSFCQEILKRFPFEANVPPGFELSEQTYSFKQQAWANLMDECEQTTNSNVKNAIDFLFEEFGLSTTQNILNNFLNQRSDWWAWTQHAKKPVGLAISKMQNYFQVDPNQKPIDDFFRNNSLEKILKDFASYLSKLKAAKYKQWLAAIAEARNSENSTKHRLHALRNAFLTTTGNPRALKQSKEMITLFGANGTDNFIQSHIEICGRLEQLTDAINLIDNFNINKHWYVAGEAYLNHYQQIKYTLRQLDFTDLEWQTFCLLTKSQHALWVQYKLDSRINHLLIDEFQDTNPIQWRLLQPLIEEFSQHQDSTESKSVLLVGDTKQSIYRFRRAEPKLFPIAAKVIEQNFKSIRKQLNASWRSSPAIINFVNTIFTDTSLLNSISDFPHHETMLTALTGCVTLIDYPTLVENSNQQDENKYLRNPLHEPRLEKISEHQLEANTIAEKIQALMHSDTLITENGKERNIQYKDIIILLRNRTNAAAYEKALHKCHIPFVGSDRGTLLDCLEVSDIMMLLNWLITPFDNIALASILRSPLFSISDKNLIEIAQVKSTEQGQSNWFNKIELLSSKKTANAQLKRAVTLLSRWRKIATVIPVHDLLDVIYNEADVLKQYHTAYPAHLKSRTQTNLTRLIELALEVDSGRYPSLQQFVAHIQHLKTLTDEAPDTPASSNNKNRVQVMTIHASKGLEAPVIFMANTDSGNDDKDKYTHNALVDWPAEKNQPNLLLLANSQQKRDRITSALIDADIAYQQRETANLFYVAITRAKQFLFISAAKQTKLEKDWYSLVKKCYTKTISGADIKNKNEFVLEQHNIKPYRKKLEPAPPLARQAEATIDKQLNISIEVNTRFTDIQQSISPSLVDSKNSTSALEKLKTNNNESDATNRGIIIHAILEAINNNPAITSEECKNIVRIEADTNNWQDHWNEAQQVLNDSQFSFIFDTNNQAYNEVSISYLENDTTVYGIIDRLIVTDKIITIIDYKTHQSVNSQNISDYAQRYNSQLAHYQQAVKRLWPQHEIQSYLLFTHAKLLHQYK